MKRTLDTFEQFANDLYQENLRGFYELESMKFGIMARLGLNEPDALELAARIVASDKRPEIQNHDRGVNKMAATQTLQRYFTQAENLNARGEGIRRDNNLSMADKLKALEALKQALEGLFLAALEGFRGEYDRLQRDYDANAAARGKAQDAELSRWDVSILAAETQAVETLLRTTPAHKLPFTFRQDANSRYKVRAWLDALGKPAYNSADYVGIRNEVKRAYEAVRMTPELQRVNERGAALIERAQALEADTVAFMTIISASGSIGGAGNEFQRLKNRLHLNRQYEGAAGFLVTFEMVPAAEDELEAGQVLA